MTGITDHHVYRFFPDRGWSEVIELAGLERHPEHRRSWADAELLEEFHRVACEVGKVPSWPVFRSRAAVGPEVYQRRFGNRAGVVARYRDWLETNNPASPLLRVLSSTGSVRRPSERISGSMSGRSPHSAGARRPDDPEYGEPLDFRGLRHAPINEQGVVYLFGVVSYDLGFLVEAVHGPYPDCVAKRRVEGKPGRWQRVRLEFEYKSSHFADHNHDPAGCDVIVCWQHDWQDCPIDVIELKSVIGELDVSPAGGML